MLTTPLNSRAREQARNVTTARLGLWSEPHATRAGSKWARPHPSLSQFRFRVKLTAPMSDSPSQVDSANDRVKLTAPMSRATRMSCVVPPPPSLRLLVDGVNDHYVFLFA